MKCFLTFFVVLFSFISCNNDVDLFSKPTSNKISIEITGDENIIINVETIEVKSGSAWKNVKRKVLNCIQYKKGYIFDSSFLDEKELTKDDVFEHNATIYVTSKLRGQNLEHNIKLTIRTDKYIEIDDAEMTIKMNTTWQEIKGEVNARLRFQLGHELLEWRIGKSKNAHVLDDAYVFKRSCTISAVSKESEKIILNLVGDENVILQYTILKLPLALRWSEIKKTEYISSASAEDGYTLSEWKIENDVNGKNISDEHIFNTDSTLYIFAIKDNFQEPSLPDTPINIEIDDLGMVTVTPPSDGIKAGKLDYNLCNYPEEQNKKLWYGVLSEGLTINIAPYKIHQYETTYKLWNEVYEWAILHGYVFENAGCKGWSLNNEQTNENEPVTKVNYRDCLVWCNAYTEKLNNSISSCVYLESKGGKVLKNAKEEKNGQNLCDNAYIDFEKKGMRLPKETEWEFAARLQIKTKINAVLCSSVYLTKLNSASGATVPICTPYLMEPNIDKMYNELFSTVVCSKFYNGYSFNYFNPKVTKTHIVGSKRANQLELHDMSGNVGEWCNIQTNTGISLGSSNKAFSIVRGGSWSTRSFKCSVGYRDATYTNFSAGNIGFRLCQTK